MPLSDEQRRIGQVFFPVFTRRFDQLKGQSTPLVHYTSAEAAINIIRSKEFWMRSAWCMNDYSEVEHGVNYLSNTYRGEAGQIFKKIVDDAHPGLCNEIWELFNEWGPSLARQAYIACFSEHHKDEDEHGRLSMWRAYGGKSGVALVLNHKPFVIESDALRAYTSPVEYCTPKEFVVEFSNLTKSIESNFSFLQQLSRDIVRNLIFNAFKYAALSTKHPGFKEEREWRVIYLSEMEQSKRLTMRVTTIKGVPQKVYGIPLGNLPDEGFVGAELPELIKKIIIGPTDHPFAIYEALVHELEVAGVKDASERLVVSGIPLR